MLAFELGDFATGVTLDFSPPTPDFCYLTNRQIWKSSSWPGLRSSVMPSFDIVVVSAGLVIGAVTPRVVTLGEEGV